MSETTNTTTTPEELNDDIVEEIDDASVVTVPIDDTLSISGEAADAKAVGDALAEKADRSELQTQVKVNYQEADAQGLILLRAEHIPMSNAQNAKNVKQAVEEAIGKTAEDIKMSSALNAPTVAEKIQNIDGKTAESILMESESAATVKDAVEEIAGAVEEVGQEISDEMSEEDVDAVLAEVFPEDEEEEA